MAKKTTYGFEGAKARNKAIERDMEALLVRRFNYLGVEAQAHARSNAGYTDRTGNLKNSIGYHTTMDKDEISKGIVANQDPVPSKDGGSIEEAVNNCNARIESFDRHVCANGVGLVVVAGMKYAPFVEAKGYNVLNLTFQYTKQNAIRDVADICKLIKKKYGLNKTSDKGGH